VTCESLHEGDRQETTVQQDVKTRTNICGETVYVNADRSIQTYPGIEVDGMFIYWRLTEAQKNRAVFFGYIIIDISLVLG